MTVLLLQYINKRRGVGFILDIKEKPKLERKQRVKCGEKKKNQSVDLVSVKMMMSFFLNISVAPYSLQVKT